MRSLVGAFAANQRAFHDRSGRGYRFLADMILAVDRLNPQTAARLVPPLGRWRRFDPARQDLMKAELERIVATPGLSKDVFEQAEQVAGLSACRHPGESRDLGETRRDFSPRGPGLRRDDGPPSALSRN